MKLYLIEYQKPGSIAMLNQWEGTLAAAKAAQRELDKEHGKVNVENFRAVELPTSKPELLLWLNRYCYHTGAHRG